MALSSKNKFFILISGICFVLTLSQCAQSPEKKETAQSDTAICKKPSVNPNGDSELALLMRQMLQSADSMKTSILAGKKPENFPSGFFKIHSAKPTDADTKHETFDGFASNYLDNLQLSCKSPKEDIVKNYNAVINTCLGCHNDHCPGPIKTIEKLLIKQ
ncbi:MAG: hypothetical protein ACXVPN_14670 [Bacteroidia bacterium]